MPPGHRTERNERNADGLSARNWTTLTPVDLVERPEEFELFQASDAKLERSGGHGLPVPTSGLPDHDVRMVQADDPPARNLFDSRSQSEAGPTSDFEHSVVGQKIEQVDGPLVPHAV